MSDMTAASRDAPPHPPPLHNMSSFNGRFMHFAAISDWRLCVASAQELEQARALLQKHRNNVPSSSSTDSDALELRKASALYQSAYHPDTGDLQNFVGRMSFQVPGGMLLTGAMLAFYRSTPAVVFWQWANQSFNALVNYTNRNAASDLTGAQLGMAYTTATTAALATALGLKKLLSGAKRFAVLQRFVPFMAVAAANVVNIPLMRQNEVVVGVRLLDDQGQHAGNSKSAAVKGISQVVSSRIVMAAPGMLLLPLIMQQVERLRWYRSPMNLPLQTLMCGASLTLMVPLACALYDQKCSVNVAQLEASEPELYSALQQKYGDQLPSTLSFNKGL
uniref:Sidoreflexin n=1 Tax=Hirondellea gigas TaxID=1518452 RepID=A0A2P2I4I6_9CRUS